MSARRETPSPGDATSNALTPGSVGVFVAEVAVYVAVVAAGWQFRPGSVVGVLTAIVAVLVMALWWGALHSPKAPLRLPTGVDLVLRGVWFAIGAAAALVVLRR